MWQAAVDLFVYEWLGMASGDRIADALNFFIYDTVKILFLLTVIIFAVTLLRSYFSTEKVREYLSKRHEFTGNILASAFGIITPFCSCSAIPLFLGNLFQQLYNTADSLIVGNFLGSNALAAHRKPETYRANLCG